MLNIIILGVVFDLSKFELSKVEILYIEILEFQKLYFESEIELLYLII